jgi:hypothetical protein
LKVIEFPRNYAPYSFLIEPIDTNI